MTAQPVVPIADSWVHPPSVDVRMQSGRAARRRVPRSSLSVLTTTTRDPLGILDEQNGTRLQDLVPLRVARMSQSPFAFYRGSAAVQAADLAADPHSGILVASCGDAHVANFGFYASPQRTLVFDLNDFDEAAWAPWEWDVKRLVTSIVIAGQDTSRDETVTQDAALAAVRAYARAIATSARMSPLERFYTHYDVDQAINSTDPASRAAMRQAIADAEKRTGERAARKLTHRDEGGRLTLVERPPTMTRAAPEIARDLEGHVFDYLDSTRPDVRVLMSNYVTADVARRVVGVGSVGTRCYLIVFQDGEDNALLLQAKEADESVLAKYGGIPQPPALTAHITAHGQGGRVVAMQRVLQAFSDPFLGYLRVPDADMYVRQFHDMKGGVDIETLDDRPFATYATACAVTLARAHAQSSTAPQVAGYIGNGRLVGEALLEWALAYAELSRSDYEAFTAANPASAQP
ncbi:DUF2252 domain-containing protein [Microbacterium sp. RU33B]|uniref:DUF2252 domain-containing protein n=1 Tax=Microbacterium sp. RU33B TaxID=1907390 RepID=UPI00095FA2EC|nr:DUF2252 domain-containing protein [Microbacterium sp. RU33B]SIT86272.1 Uncharacterized conserved protein, DUF2252 family [Microbacterium sp. RU33B]